MKACLMILLGVLMSKAALANNCAAALITDTYQSSRSVTKDWRLAQFVSRSQFEEAKKNGNGSAVIYGVPVEGSYEDFQKKISQELNIHNESLTTAERDNILWTGTSSLSADNYQACLRSNVFGQKGLRAAVTEATPHDVTVRIRWFGRPERIPLEWSAATLSADLLKRLPKTANLADTEFVLPRPSKPYTLVANYAAQGETTGAIVITPFPKKPPAVSWCKDSWSESGLTVNVRNDAFCRQRISWKATGSFRKGCGDSAEAAEIRYTTGNGRQVLKTWSDTDFENSRYTNLEGSFVVPAGESGRIELVRTLSRCSNPAGSIDMTVSVSRLE